MEANCPCVVHDINAGPMGHDDDHVTVRFAFDDSTTGGRTQPSYKQPNRRIYRDSTRDTNSSLLEIKRSIIISKTASFVLGSDHESPIW